MQLLEKLKKLNLRQHNFKVGDSQNHAICKNMTMKGTFSNMIVKTILLISHLDSLTFIYQYSYYRCKSTDVMEILIINYLFTQHAINAN